MRICEAALGRGVFAQAIRPPTVAPGSSRLRLAVMASHREEELRGAARTLAQVARAEGFEPRTRAQPMIEGEDDLEWEESRPTRVFDFEQPERRAA
jgi:glycine C-acetyltransferase/8-amino-7-oxononanoate synthase